MEEKETVDPAYLQGFNEGYIIAQHLPELSQKLAKIETSTPHIEGLKDGRNQFVLEAKEKNYPAWLKSDKGYTYEDIESPEKDIDERDMDKE
jgi:hypothetical protein